MLGKLIEHNTSTGAYKKYYLFNGKLLALREGLSSGFTYRYLVTDHLGSLNTTLNLDGNVYSDLRYAPFGKQRWAINTKAHEERIPKSDSVSCVQLPMCKSSNISVAITGKSCSRQQKAHWGGGE